jgi:hypothetical protein
MNIFFEWQLVELDGNQDFVRLVGMQEIIEQQRGPSSKRVEKKKCF